MVSPATEPVLVPDRKTDRPKPRRTGVRRRRKRGVRTAWIVAGFAGLVPVLIGGTWLVAREGRPAASKAPEVNPRASKPVETPPADTPPADPKADVPHPYPPPKKGFGPPEFGPGSPGFGPPPGGPLPFPRSKD
jgi:hypothetical protein